MLMLFGAVAMFLGLVTGYLALTSGEISFTTGASSHTIRRMADAAGFWRGVGLGSVLPMLAGTIVFWFGRRRYRRLGDGND